MIQTSVVFGLVMIEQSLVRILGVLVCCVFIRTVAGRADDCTGTVLLTTCKKIVILLLRAETFPTTNFNYKSNYRRNLRLGFGNNIT